MAAFTLDSHKVIFEDSDVMKLGLFAFCNPVIRNLHEKVTASEVQTSCTCIRIRTNAAMSNHDAPISTMGFLVVTRCS